MGQRVLLIDADLGLANSHILLGASPRHHLGHVLDGTVGLDDALEPGPHGIRVLSASSGEQELTRLDDAQKQHLLASLDPLDDRFDLVIIDCGAGIGDNVVFFAGAAQMTLLVVTPEPTSLTDAYAAVKVLSQRGGVRHFSVVVNWASDNRQGRDVFQKLVRVTDLFLPGQDELRRQHAPRRERAARGDGAAAHRRPLPPVTGQPFPGHPGPRPAGLDPAPHHGRRPEAHVAADASGSATHGLTEVEPMTGAHARYIPSPEDGEEAILKRHGSLVDRIARRYATRSGHAVSADDLWSAGALGLIDAARRFDPARDIRFETFAEHRVRGAIVDELRRMDHLPRRLRGEVERVMKARAKLAQNLGREPSTDEIADVGRARGRGDRRALRALHAPAPAPARPATGGGARRPPRAGGPAPARRRRVPPPRAAPHLARPPLPGGISPIARRRSPEILDISQPRVCQLHAEAVAQLKKLLAPP